MGEGQHPTPPSCNHPAPHKEGKRLRRTWESHSPGAQAHLIQDYRAFPSPTPHDDITKGPFTTVLLTRYIMSGFQHYMDTKRQKTHFKETEQASEPDSDVAGMSELSHQELKIIKINMPGE